MFISFHYVRHWPRPEPKLAGYLIPCAHSFLAVLSSPPVVAAAFSWYTWVPMSLPAMQCNAKFKKNNAKQSQFLSGSDGWLLAAREIYLTQFQVTEPSESRSADDIVNSPSLLHFAWEAAKETLFAESALSPICCVSTAL